MGLAINENGKEKSPQNYGSQNDKSYLFEIKFNGN